MQNFVFDSLPLLTFFRKQKGWEAIRELLNESRTSGNRHAMSAINWGEVYYMILRDEGRETAKMVDDRIRNSPIEIVLPSMSQVVHAAEFKAGGGISYADCFAAALAAERAIPILTSDPEFKAVEALGVKIEWLPPNR